MSTPIASSSTLTQRIIESAISITIAEGWAGLTMSRLASDVGVSRQTIYNEVGSKPQLAELIVLTEAAKFLDAVNTSFDAHKPDYRAALRHAAQQVLQMGIGNDLLRSVIGAGHGVQSALLPLLTTQSQSLLTMATAVVSVRLQDCGITALRADLVAETVVRLVLSHLMQPSDSPGTSSERIVCVVAPVLALPPEKLPGAQ